MTEDTKTCPMCAETVKAAAVRCRFCQHDFTGAAPAKPIEARVEKAANGAANGIMKVGCGLVAILLLVAFCAPRGADTSKPADPTPETIQATRANALKVTARDLAQAYENNEAAAQAQYGGRWLEVTGTVDGVDLDFMDEPVVKLVANNQFMPAMADLTDTDKPRASSLRKGQNIILLCQGITEIIGSPSLKECSIVK